MLSYDCTILFILKEIYVFLYDFSRYEEQCRLNRAFLCYQHHKVSEKKAIINNKVAGELATKVIKQCSDLKIC